MRLVAGLVVAALFVAFFRKAIKQKAWPFYLFALLLNELIIFSSSFALPPWFREYFLFLLQSNNLAMGLFTIVMFTGVLNDHSKLKTALLGIRAELSIIASILSMGHIIFYGQSYFAQILDSFYEVPFIRICASMIALLLILLLIPLALTSFQVIRSRMSVRGWRRLQLLAYPFYGLIFIHLLLFLLPPAIAGSTSAAISVSLYLVLGVAYAVLRVRLYLQRKQGQSLDRTKAAEVA